MSTFELKCRICGVGDLGTFEGYAELPYFLSRTAVPGHGFASLETGINAMVEKEQRSFTSEPSPPQHGSARQPSIGHPCR